MHRGVSTFLMTDQRFSRKAPVTSPTAHARARGRQEAGAAIRIMVVSNCALLRDGISCIFANYDDVVVIGDAPCSTDVVVAIERANPQVVLLDITGCPDVVVDQVAQARFGRSNFHLIVLSYGREEELVLKVLELGAQGYLCGAEDKYGLMEAIHCVTTDDVYLCPGACGALIRDYRRRMGLIRGGETEWR